MSSLNFPTVTRTVESSLYGGQYGKFEVNEFSVPYLTTVVDAFRLKEDFNLINNDPHSLLDDWSVQELFQRDLQWRRVDEMSKQYLGQPSHPPFFNSLTIALVCNGEDTSAVLDPPSVVKPDWQASGHNGAKIWWESESANDQPMIGKPVFVKWNKSNTKALAIDGQHRLAAIQEWAKSTTPEKAAKLSVPVIILLLDPGVGYVAGPGVSDNEYMRKAFIDLNKRAVTVSRSRELLLDDGDPVSLCIRSVIGEQLNFELDDKPSSIVEGQKIGKLGEYNSRVPLSLVDWYTDNAKVDSGPNVTSILQLAWMVEVALSSPLSSWAEKPPMKYPLAGGDDLGEGYYGNWFEFVRKWKLDSELWAEKIEAAQEKGKPVVFSAEEFSKIGDYFNEQWGFPFTQLLLGISPLRNLVAQRVQESTVCNDFSTWHSKKLSAEEGGRQNQRDLLEGVETLIEDRSGDGRLIQSYEALLTKINNEIKLVDNPAASPLVYLTGQRGLFLAYLKFHKRQGQVIQDRISVDEHLPESSSKAAAIMLSVSINAWDELGIMAKNVVVPDSYIDGDSSDDVKSIRLNLWAGSLLDRVELTVGYQKVDAERTSSLIELLNALYWCIKSAPSLSEENLREMVKFDTDGEEHEQLEMQYLKAAIKRYRLDNEDWISDGASQTGSKNKCPMYFLAKASDWVEWDDDKRKEVLEAITFVRVKYLYDQMSSASM
jgi:hypothetical protein